MAGLTPEEIMRMHAHNNAPSPNPVDSANDSADLPAGKVHDHIPNGATNNP